VAKSFATMPDGSRILVRAAYRAVDFSVPQTELDRIAEIRPGFGSLDVLDERDGELSMYHRVKDFERDGATWTLLQHPGEYAIEVELTRGAMGAVRCLPPLEAWALARELDQAETRYPIAVEDSWELQIAGDQPGPA
jgi:hypothetical protein